MLFVYSTLYTLHSTLYSLRPRTAEIRDQHATLLPVAYSLQTSEKDASYRAHVSSTQSCQTPKVSESHARLYVRYNHHTAKRMCTLLIRLSFIRCRTMGILQCIKWCMNVQPRTILCAHTHTCTHTHTHTRTHTLTHTHTHHGKRHPCLCTVCMCDLCTVCV